MRRLDVVDRIEEIKVWISENRSKAFICRNLKCKWDTFERCCKQFGLDYKGNQGSKGKPSKKKKTAIEYLQSNDYISSHRLRKKLIEDGIKEHRCEICNNTDWQGNPIPLELDHIDGNHFNYDFKNLRIICPNCHAQTETNSGKNSGRYKN